MLRKPKFLAKAKTKAGQLGKPTAKAGPSVLALLGHFAMGFAIGLSFALVLATDQRFGVREMILSSATPHTSMLVLLASFGAVFGIGATLTGFVLMMMERQ